MRPQSVEKLEATEEILEQERLCSLGKSTTIGYLP